jgi:hypothetical protein
MRCNINLQSDMVLVFAYQPFQDSHYISQDMLTDNVNSLNQIQFKSNWFYGLILDNR